MKKIVTNKAPMAIGPYSQAIIVGNVLYTSGQIAINPDNNEIIEDDIIAQTHQVIKNISNILISAGTSLDNVIKTTVFIKDINNFSKVNEIYGQYFKECPARSLVEVSKLPKNALIEIEAIAEIK